MTREEIVARADIDAAAVTRVAADLEAMNEDMTRLLEALEEYARLLRERGQRRPLGLREEEGEA